MEHDSSQYFDVASWTILGSSTRRVIAGLIRGFQAWILQLDEVQGLVSHARGNFGESVKDFGYRMSGAPVSLREHLSSRGFMMSNPELSVVKTPESDQVDQLEEENIPLIERVYPVLQGPDENILLVIEHISQLFVTNYTGLGPQGSGSILKVFLDALSKSTGAHFYATGCWDDSTNNTICTSYSTPEVSGFASTKDGVAARDLFMIHAEKTLGPCFTTDILKAHPVVYGLEADNFRPRLPPLHPNPFDEKSNILSFMIKTADWQGSHAPINWPQVEIDRRSLKPLIIDRWRLPTNCPTFGSSLPWTAQQLSSLGRYFRDHQARLDRGDITAEATAFQWRTVFDVDGAIAAQYDTYSRKIHPRSTLTYPQEAAFYMSSLTLHSILQPELQSCFSEADRAVVQKLHILGESRMDYFDTIDRFLRTRTPEADITTLPSCPRIVQHLRDHPSSIDELSRNYLLPDPFYFLTDREFDSWSIQAFLNWTNSGAIVVKGSGLTANGPYGALLAYIALITLALNVQIPLEPAVPRGAIAFKPGQNEENMLQLAGRNLHVAVESGLRGFWKDESSKSVRDSRSTAWEPSGTYLLTPEGRSDKYEPGNWRTLGPEPMAFKRPATSRPRLAELSLGPENARPAHTSREPPLETGSPANLNETPAKQSVDTARVSLSPAAEDTTSAAGMVFSSTPRRLFGDSEAEQAVGKFFPSRGFAFGSLNLNDNRQTRSERPVVSDLPLVDEAPRRRSQSVDRHPGASIMDLDDVDIAPPDPTDSPASKDSSTANREALAPSEDTPQTAASSAGNNDGNDVRGSGKTLPVERRATPLDERRDATPAGSTPFVPPIAGPSAASKKRGTLLGMVNAHLNAVGPSSPGPAIEPGSTSVGFSRASEQPSSRRASSRVPATKRSRTAFSPETGPAPKKRSASRGGDKRGD
ncbi:hypothetical protein BDV93DRAFT_510605 [Ceratobasidium sp. AG-I]|nr:hypothetical protein BDV93DRAFT_510605 [Ceratobasidium sp. AG-I]